MIQKRKFNRKTVFVVSDIHGHRDELESALRHAGFDPENSRHLLVAMGDFFDRGNANRAVYEYLCSVKNKILLRGNHEDILSRALISGIVGSLQERNGTLNTLREFFPGYSGGAYLPIADDTSRRNRRELIRFTDSLGCFYETEHYIFTHGWLPVLDDGSLSEDWRHAGAEEWSRARWSRWKDLYGITRIPKGKTLVVGHTPVIYYARGFDPNRPAHSIAPFYGEQMIAIDACTVESGKVNVLALEDEVPESVECKVNVPESVYDVISKDASVFVGLFRGELTDLRTGDILTFICEGREELSRNVVSTHRYEMLADVEDVFSPDVLGLSGDASLSELYRGAYSLDELIEYGCIALTLE